MKKLYMATYESRHFNFVALGKSESEARQAVVTGLKEHTRQYGNEDYTWWEGDDIGVTEMIVGEAYRDGSVIKEGG